MLYERVMVKKSNEKSEFISEPFNSFHLQPQRKKIMGSVVIRGTSSLPNINGEYE